MSDGTFERGAERRKARLRIVADADPGAADECPTTEVAALSAELERRKLMHRNAIGLAPIFFACLTAIIVRETIQPRQSATGVVWLVLACVVDTTSLILFAVGVVRGGGRVESAALQRAVVCGAAVALFALVAFPWIFGSAMPALREMQMFLAAAAVFGATAMFSGLRGWIWLPSAVPASWVGLDVIEGAFDPAHVPVLVVPGLVIALLTIVLTGGVFVLHRAIAQEMVTARRQLRELAAARDVAEEADRDKSRFLAIASHDLRQPLYALGLFAAALEKRLRGTGHEPIAIDMVQSVDGLNQSFNALMDVSQLDAGVIKPRFQRFPLRDIFRRLHMHFAGQAELAGLALRFSAGGKSVTSDPQLLERVLGNLIQNALKYTVTGGVVVVARTTATHFNIEVWDTGLGISDIELPRVFHEYYQIDRKGGTRARGLGMGLAIVKRLVRLLGHDLVVVSSPGSGSMFRVSIPCGSLSEIEDATAAADTLPMPLFGQRTALVIDDDVAIRTGLDLLLAEWGYRAVCASNHDEACYALRVTESVPDLILCDLHLGGGLDGIAVIRSIRRQCGRELPAILITGDPSRDEVARTIGSDLLVLSKPVQPRVLRDALRSLEEQA